MSDNGEGYRRIKKAMDRLREETLRRNPYANFTEFGGDPLPGTGGGRYEYRNEAFNSPRPGPDGFYGEAKGGSNFSEPRGTMIELEKDAEGVYRDAGGCLICGARDITDAQFKCKRFYGEQIPGCFL